MKKIVRKFNRDERANLSHALIHLEHNDIANENVYNGWYHGNKEQIAFILALLKRDSTGFRKDGWLKKGKTRKK